MDIRRATLEDAELLGRLVQAVHDIHVEARPDFFKPYAFTSELIEDYRQWLLDQSIDCLIAEIKGETIGYALAQVVERPENPYTYAQYYLLVDQ
jgi:hypothetical protein